MANPQTEDGYTAIANEIMEALARTRITSEARCIFDLIIRKTWGFKKKEDNISLSQFCLGTGIKRANVCRALKQLQNHSFIIKRDNKYSIIKDFSLWKTPIKRDNTLSNGITNVIKRDNKRYQTGDIQKKVTKETITKEKKISPADASPFVQSLLASPLFKSQWGAFLEMRRSIKKSPTERASELLLKKLESLSGNNLERAIKIVERSIMNSWQGFFPLPAEEAPTVPQTLEEEVLQLAYTAVREKGQGNDGDYEFENLVLALLRKKELEKGIPYKQQCYRDLNYRTKELIKPHMKIFYPLGDIPVLAGEPPTCEHQEHLRTKTNS